MDTVKAKYKGNNLCYENKVTTVTCCKAVQNRDRALSKLHRTSTARLAIVVAVLSDMCSGESSSLLASEYNSDNFTIDTRLKRGDMRSAPSNMSDVERVDTGKSSLLNFSLLESWILANTLV